ncbi:MAG: amino acid adenylation domain-containing protein, partial [Candidatus Aminicenantes bacterium]
MMHWFEDQVEKTPGSIALMDQDRHYISYEAFNKKSNQLARTLKKKGVGADTIVGLMVDRSIPMMIGLYGILKAGGAYMPVAPDYPLERVRYMLDESGSSLLLTMEKYTRTITFAGEVINVEDESLYRQQDSSNPSWDTGLEDLIYVIYTSGSTGRPKGVPIKTRGFVNLVNWYIMEFKLDGDDKFLLIAPISFDLAQKNLFAPLVIGGCLCLASPGLFDFDELSGFIALEGQTIINCAPTVFYPFVELNGSDGFERLRSLRYVFLGGEPIRMDQLAPWLDSGVCNCEIINTYGPTECTDVVSYYRIPGEKGREPRIIPIGKPVANVTLYVLDKRQNLLPVGLCGEVCIGGIGVGPGYLNNPELAAQKFQISNKKGPVKKFYRSYMSYRSYIYKTGDLGRWLADGNIEFLGRMDFQVKIRGLRIELGEIEDQLLKHDKVKEVAVIVIADGNKGNYLCAYLVLVSPGSLDAFLKEDLKEYLSKYLPNYMVPGYFLEMESLPLTPSGKVDRKALPLPGLDEFTGTYAAPCTPTQEKLAVLWSELLGIEKD